MIHKDRQNGHMDVKQQFSWPIFLQIAAMLIPLIAVYASLTGNDRAFQGELDRMRLDIVRVESAARDMKQEIRADLQSIITEIRELRTDVNKNRK